MNFLAGMSARAYVRIFLIVFSNFNKCSENSFTVYERSSASGSTVTEKIDYGCM